MRGNPVVAFNIGVSFLLCARDRRLSENGFLAHHAGGAILNAILRRVPQHCTKRTSTWGSKVPDEHVPRCERRSERGAGGTLGVEGGGTTRTAAEKQKQTMQRESTRVLE